MAASKSYTDDEIGHAAGQIELICTGTKWKMTRFRRDESGGIGFYFKGPAGEPTPDFGIKCFQPNGDGTVSLVMKTRREMGYES